jgi:hypothetical protein
VKGRIRDKINKALEQAPADPVETPGKAAEPPKAAAKAKAECVGIEQHYRVYVAARRVGVSSNTLRDLLKGEVLPRLPGGGKRRAPLVPESMLQRLMERLRN